MRRTASKRILFCITSGFVLVMMFGLLMLLSIASTYTEGAQAYDVLRHVIVTPQMEVLPVQSLPDLSDELELTPLDIPYEEAAVESPETFTLPDTVTLPEVDFGVLREVNSNVVAWLILEGTPINYPVVQGENNYHYLEHLFDGTRNRAGTLFVDSYNLPGFADHNTIIYGHHMQNGSMFAALVNYRTQTFFDAHPWAFLITPEGNYVIQFFAGYTTDVEAPSWRLEFADEAEFTAWIETSRLRSDFESEVEVSASDRLVTLSTCSWAFDNARYVLIGKLVPIG